MEAIVLVGVSGSGKSTLAREYAKKDYKVLDRDDIRFSLTKARNWEEYKFDKKIEQLITNIHTQMASHLMNDGYNIVVAETNLNQKTRNGWIKTLEGLGYEVKVVPVEVTLEEAFDRDSKREYSVGRDVIVRQWPRWLNFLEEYNGIQKV